jgi:hypothetical protein
MKRLAAFAASRFCFWGRFDGLVGPDVLEVFTVKT